MVAQARMRLAHYTLDMAEAASTSQPPNPYASLHPPLSAASSHSSLASLHSSANAHPPPRSVHPR